MNISKPALKTACLLVALGLIGTPAYAGEEDDAPVFYSRLFAQAYGGGFGLVSDSPFNPDNSLGLPEDLAAFDVRADFGVEWKSLDVLFKPRYTGRRSKIQTPTLEDSPSFHQTNTDLFVNEWHLRAGLGEGKVFLSYGRENLQWGPSFLKSTSNPFNERNGQNNPLVEQPGLDYGRIIWVPSAHWSASLIANTDEGQLNIEEDEFVESYAVKVDYSSEGRYASLIPSVKDDENDTFTLGYYGGYAANDALSVYLEGNTSDAEKTSATLLGLSYTSIESDILSVEYLYQDGGCTVEPYEDCQLASADGSTPRFSLIELSRQNYLLLQGTKFWNYRETQLTLRLIHNIDDQSSRFIAYGEHDLDDHFVLFGLGNITTGDQDTEFGALATFSVLAGFSYTF